MTAASISQYRTPGLIGMVGKPVDPAFHEALQEQLSVAAGGNTCSALLCHQVHAIPCTGTRLMDASDGMSVAFSPAGPCIRVLVCPSYPPGQVWTLIRTDTVLQCLRTALDRHFIMRLLSQARFSGAVCRTGAAMARTADLTPALWQAQAALAMAEAREEAGHLCFFGPQVLSAPR